MRNKVLIVDDVEINREMLRIILEADYPILEAESGRVAIEMLGRYRDEIAVVLLDLIMPDVDGYTVLEMMGEQNLMGKIPVLVISGESAPEVEKRCFNLGVSDFVRKPLDNVMVKKRVKNVVDLFLYRNELEEKVEQQTQTLRSQYRLLQKQAEILQKSNEQLIDILGTVVEYRNLESGEHIKRVKGFTRILAEEVMQTCPEYGLTPERIKIIVETSALHDVGKIVIPDRILLKPGRLDKDEFECMKTHTIKGCEILDSLNGVWDDKYNKVAYAICRYHHERYNGKGYPDGLEGDAIPIEAQLVSVADVYDALVTERVYKKAFPKDVAFQMIQNGECGVFSQKLMECFKRARVQFEELAG